MDIVRSLDERYPSTPSINGPKELKDEIDLLERSFKSIFPRNTRPSSRAAFLFSSSGGLLFKSEFEKTLRRTEELLGKHSSGAFFAGEDFTIADVAWVPFLERYSEQLPWLHRYRC